MRVRSRSRISPRASKRKRRAESSSAAASEPQQKRITKRNEGEQREPPNPIARCSTVFSSIMVDKYCWLCHTETDDRICVTCHRAYHNDCLDKIPASFSELGVCPECQNKSVDGTELNSKINLDKLKRMLDVLTRRSFDKKRVKNEIFLRWAEEDRDKLFKIIDFEILLDNINHVPPYTKTAEFYGDVKFIHHNSCIIYGAHSDQAKAAEILRRDFKKELLDLEACPECYYHLYCDEYCDESDCHDPFIRLCGWDPVTALYYPHDIVWAQLTGHPYWPAKCLKVVKGLAHVRFFGEHEQSNIPINKCLFLSASHPKNKNSNLKNPENSGPKSQRFKSARFELLKYIRLYEQKCGDFPFHPHKTPYKPQEKVVVSSAEGSSCRNMVELKLEGNSMNEDSEPNIINAVEFPEGNLNFPNSGSNDRSPNGFVPACFKETSLKSHHPEGNENSVGQYSTYQELLSSVNPTPFTKEPSEGVLAKKPSPVTSIDMSFSSDETANIENCSKNPVVASIESLQPIYNESSPITLSSAESNSLDCGLRFLENSNRIHSEGSKGTEVLQCTEILSETVANISSNDSLIQPDTLNNFMSNLPIFTGNQAESDNEVQCIGEIRNMEAYESFNPDIVVPFLEENSPELKTLLQKARYVADGLIIDLWASVLKNPNSVGRISKVCGDLKKCRSDLKTMKEENNRIKKEEEEHKFQIQSLTEQVKTLQVEVESLLQKINSEEAKWNKAKNNCKTIVNRLKSSCHKNIEERLTTQYKTTIQEKEDKLKEAENTVKYLEEEKRQLIQEKEDKLKEAENTVKYLEEEKRQLEKELEEARLAKLSAEDKLKVTKSQNNVFGRDDITMYKTMHYCCVCQVAAAIVCCLNTSYCSKRCQEKDAEKHQKHCKREKQFILHQTVSHKTFEYSLNVKRSTVNNPSNSEMSAIDSMTGSTDHKKAETPSVSALPALPAPHDRGMASSSRSFHSKSKRRSYK